VYYYDVPGLTNIITIAGPGVNQISWKYFCNPWYAPVYMYYNSTYGCWVIKTPRHEYKSTDWYATVPHLRDLLVIEVIYIKDEGRHVVWASGFSGYGSRAACYFLKCLISNEPLVETNGIALLIYWEDTNNSYKPDEEDTWNIVEILEIIPETPTMIP
ncbi:MAG: hypothetical protein DRJ32_07065, partial [Thermoprotei archaeon]